jgi:type IV secretory pathway VirD2 relaxase
MAQFLGHDDDLEVHLRGGNHGSATHLRWPSLGHTLTPRPSPAAVVKVGYMRVGRVAGYAAYIERDGTADSTARAGSTATQGYSGYIGRAGAGEDGTRAYLFTRLGASPDRDEFIARSHEDPRAWTIILSPGNGLEMDRYVRAVMHQMALDLGKPLDWIAATHYNTPYTHSHVLLRGKDRDGSAFRLDRDYIRTGLRARATEIARLHRSLGYTQHRARPGHEAAMRSQITQVTRQMEAWVRRHAREARTR